MLVDIDIKRFSLIEKNDYVSQKGALYNRDSKSPLVDY